MCEFSLFTSSFTVGEAFGVYMGGVGVRGDACEAPASELKVYFEFKDALIGAKPCPTSEVPAGTSFGVSMFATCDGNQLSTHIQSVIPAP